MICPSCGTENPEGSRYCMSCASPLAASAPVAAPPVPAAPPAPMAPPAPHRLRHREPHEDLVGLMGLAFVLFAIATVFAINSNLATDIQAWTHLAQAHNSVFVRPPEGIISGAAWFFAVVGILEFAAAGLRWALHWTPLRVAGRALSGVGDLVFAALLFLYSARTISGAFLLTVLAGSVGVLLVMYVSLGILWASARAAPRPEPVPPPTQH
jgi:hypothetical protein